MVVKLQGKKIVHNAFQIPTHGMVMLKLSCLKSSRLEEARKKVTELFFGPALFQSIRAAKTIVAVAAPMH